MERERKNNKAVRAAYRGHSTRDSNKARELMDSEEPNVEELEAIMGRLSRRMKEIEEMDIKIRITLDDPEQIEEEVEDSLQFSDATQDLQLKINKFLQRECQSEVNRSVSKFQLNNSFVNTPSLRAHVKLPEITIKKFSGDPLDWLTFWDSFSEAIDKDPNMSGIQKMNYLNGYLKGEAARAVSGLPLTNENYLKSIELLKDRFGRNQVLINAYMESLIKITAPSNDVKKLRVFYDSCENYIRGLESLGVVSDTYGSLLIPVLMKKLPEEVRRLIIRANSLADSSLNELRNGLRQEIETLEKSHMSTFSPQESTSGEVQPSTAGALLAGMDPPDCEKQKSKTCVFCNGNHKPENCDKVTSVEGRVAILIHGRKCFNCFNGNHMQRQCFAKKRCSNCKRKHHTSICTTKNTEKSPEDTKKKKPPKQEEGGDIHKDTPGAYQGVTQAGDKDVIMMQSALITVRGNNNSAQARALFDTGSQRTFITNRLSEILHLKPMSKEVLDVATFGSKKRERTEYKVVSLMLLAKNENINVTALVSPTICPPITAKAEYIMQAYPEISGLNLADNNQITSPTRLEVDMLIGNDYYGHLMTGEMIKCEKNGVIATESKFGWLVSGPASHRDDTEIVCQRVDADEIDEVDLDKLLPRFWELDVIGIQESNDNETNEVLEKFQHDIKFKEKIGRYIVRLPWKEFTNRLPSNLSLCKKRLRSLRQSLDKRGVETLNKYDQQIQDQLQRGFIEKVKDIHIHEGMLHFIAHFPVFKDSLTTRMRIVYDASAKMGRHAVSLNDCLHTGPNLLQDLTGILLKFRIHRIAIIADIEKAFLQIELDERDRDATRFLWLKDVEKPADDNNLEVYRFCRVLFGAAPSPFLLNATVQYHLDNNAKNSDWIAKDLKNSMYMDNVVTGVSNDEKAVQYYMHSRELMKTAGMNLRQWSTNSTVLQQKVQKDDSGMTGTLKVLGLIWNSERDVLSLSVKKIIEDVKQLKKITKRSVLSIAATIFDPLGFVEPFTVKAKILMQTLWERKVTWDEELPADLNQEWIAWIRDIEGLLDVEIPRQYFISSDHSKLQLHVFCDSSPKAYGAVAYLRNKQNEGSQAHVMQVMSKSRVAPLKQKTLPVLELLAAVLGARLSKYIIEHLTESIGDIEKCMWSDSQIVLSWLSSKTTLKRNVASKVQAIKDDTLNGTWRYCPTQSNPADLLTRGTPSRVIANKASLWLHGPTWLKEGTNAWPVWVKQNETEDLDEYRSGLICNVIAEDTSPSLLKIINLEKFSKLEKLIRVTALVLKFIVCCKRASQKENFITTEEYENAKQMLIKAVQRSNYSSEIMFLTQPSKVKCPSIVQQLGLFIDEKGLIRCQGRIEHSQLPLDAKQPILLPKDNHLTTLIVLAMHYRVLHNGVGETLTEIRQTFWIPKGRQLIKRLISKCVICKKAEGKPFHSMKTPPLPKSRVSGNHAFQTTGVDYAGPIFIRGTAGTPCSKMYICLFTCANIRAVHLELVENLTAEAFIRAFKRFINRRGVPEYIISDNAKNFKAASIEIIAAKNQILETEKSQHFLASHGITWQFIAERAPWWGGFYERLVGTMKRCLKKSMGKASLKIFEVTTILTEVEATLNSRPLTYPSSDINDLTPLTPSHFLCGFRIMNLPEVKRDDEEFIIKETTPTVLTNRVKYIEKVMKSFWVRWQKEYLTSLRQNHKIQKCAEQKSVVKVGDVVLIHENLPRNNWKLGRVEKTFPGIDGLVRVVHVRNSDGKTLRRAIERLYPLEICDTSNEDKEVDKGPERPKRAAAVKAKTKIREMSEHF